MSTAARSDRTRPARGASLRLAPERGLGPELVRVVREQVAFLASWASTERGRPGERVHRVRQALKRLRAVARLVRPLVGERCFARVNRGLRSEGRRLCAARDADVVLQACERLVRQGERSGGATALRKVLAERARAAQRTLLESDVLAGVSARVVRLEARMLDALPSRVSAAELRRGAEATWKRARRQWRRALESAAAKELHELRKRAKVVRTQAELLGRASGRRARWVAELDRLNDLLGEERDMALLEAWLMDEAGRHERDSVFALLGRVTWRRRRLRERALSCAARAFGAHQAGP
jgi:CHAD domain-containing protein